MSLKEKLVFVVDDDPLINRLVGARLEAEGFRVKSFSFGEDCINALHENPDLVILDFFFVMENRKPMNGMETFDRLREINPGLPVIILSAQERGEVMIDLARKGITDYVIKDNNLFDNLIVSVREIMEK